ncbi:MAG: ribosome maturation factor RimP [Desulfobacteraceae bacterium]|nr:MAG: ribosome maturation factor RimP [Desulfobacteraceae bacterium]
MSTFSSPGNEGNSLADKVRAVAEPLCFSENFELVHVECIFSKKETIIRIYMDKPGGIKIDDCVYVSRQLGDLIDIEIENLGAYRLEVSSPGINRPLNKQEDFVRFKGHRVKVEIDPPIDNRRKFTGVIEDVTDESIVIAYDGNTVNIQSKQICKATLADQ